MISTTEDQFDRFHCLDGADDPGQNAEDAAFRARRHQPWRRRFRIEAAVARTIGHSENGGLPFKPENRAVHVWLSEQNASVVDNFPTRYLVNDACILLRKPNVYGSIFRFEGQATVVGSPDCPCYRCLDREPPPPGLVPSCAEGGVLGVLPGIVGSIQAMETIKLILGRGDHLRGRLLLFDALGMKFRELKLRKNPDCPMCGTHPTISKLIDYYEFCGVRGEEAAGPSVVVPEIAPRELKARLDRGDDLFILDVREPHEYQICNLQGHLLPLGELTRRVHELDSSREIVAHCRSGKRSAEAVDFLRKAGFRKILNLKGGILAWSDEVDPSVPKY